MLPVDASAIQQHLLGDPAVAGWFRSSGPFTLAECDELVTNKVAHRAAHGFGWSLAWEEAHVRATLRQFADLVAATDQPHLPQTPPRLIKNGCRVTRRSDRGGIIEWQDGHLDAAIDEVIEHLVRLFLLAGTSAGLPGPRPAGT